MSFRLENCDSYQENEGGKMTSWILLGIVLMEVELICGNFGHFQAFVSIEQADRSSQQNFNFSNARQFLEYLPIFISDSIIYLSQKLAVD